VTAESKQGWSFACQHAHLAHPRSRPHTTLTGNDDQATSKLTARLVLTSHIRGMSPSWSSYKYINNSSCL